MLCIQLLIWPLILLQIGIAQRIGIAQQTETSKLSSRIDRGIYHMITNDSVYNMVCTTSSMHDAWCWPGGALESHCYSSAMCISNYFFIAIFGNWVDSGEQELQNNHSGYPELL